MDCPFCDKPLPHHSRADLYECILTMGETNAKLVEALEDLVDIARRDNVGDPDYSPSDAWRIETMNNGIDAIADAQEATS